jgi:protein-tyrosine phosphatase
MAMTALSYGRIDVHAHLLPAVDDGCPTVGDSVACARRLVEAGYTHAFCTPHVWPDLPHNNRKSIPQRVAELQSAYNQQQVPLHLIPGGEIGLRTQTLALELEEVVSYAMRRKCCLVDFWGNVLPSFFGDAVKHLQSMGLQVILAHPERMRAVQDHPEVVEKFTKMGLLLQGNLQCFDDPTDSPTRLLAEKYLLEDRYFMLGSDTHNFASLECRMRGLTRASDLVGEEKVWTLTRDHPKQLLPPGV